MPPPPCLSLLLLLDKFAAVMFENDAVDFPFPVPFPPVVSFCGVGYLNGVFVPKSPDTTKAKPRRRAWERADARVNEAAERAREEEPFRSEDEEEEEGTDATPAMLLLLMLLAIELLGGGADARRCIMVD